MTKTQNESNVEKLSIDEAVTKLLLASGELWREKKDISHIDYRRDLSIKTGQSASLIKKLQAQNRRLVEALEDIAYCKSWTINNKPLSLVSTAIKALKSVREDG